MRSAFVAALVVVAPLVASLAWASDGGGDFEFSVDPASLDATPGADVVVTLRIVDGSGLGGSFDLSAQPDEGSGLAVTLASTSLSVPPNGTAQTSATVHVAGNASAGTRQINFSAAPSDGASPRAADLQVTIAAPDPATSTPPPSSTPSATTPSSSSPPAPTPQPSAAPSNGTAPANSTAPATTPSTPAPASPSPSPAAPTPVSSPPIAPASSSPPPARASADASVPQPSHVDARLVVAAAAASVGGGALLAAWASRRWASIVFALAPLYTRLARSELLDQTFRARMAQVVEANPGITFRELQRRLDASSGQVAHHARLLQDAGILYSSADGQQRRFYLVAHGFVAPVASLAERALAALAAGPRTMAELARDLGVSRAALRYHVVQLERAGRVATRREGRELLVTRVAGGEPQAASSSAPSGAA